VTGETVFTYGAPDLKFGPGAADEIGYELSSRYGVRRVLIVTDAGVAATGSPGRVAQAIRSCSIEVEIFASVHIEPTDTSLREAVAAARASGPWDAFVAVGGGSSIDTAKAVNLLTTNPGDLMDYLNAPIGGGLAPTQPLKPLVAVPTTTGTGSESTTICVLDVLDLKVKTGISHARLRPALAVVDPLLTMTQPAAVTAAAGMDVLCHALESYTAMPYTLFPRKSPEQRVPYCGANPVADMWSRQALTLLARSLRRAVADGTDVAARTDMALAATFAGMGFGNAGVHIPHANAYPIAGNVRGYHPDGYPAGQPLVPHGMAVALTAPEAFRFTFTACPDRHIWAAHRLAQTAADTRIHTDALLAALAPHDRLPAVLTELMRDIGVPNGISAIGYTGDDIATLAAGAMKQQRLLATAPRPVTEADVVAILTRSLTLW
jgi:hydroxyacid-oxoacid transhydrogenase